MRLISAFVGIFLLLIQFAFPLNVSAATQEFSTSYDVAYDVGVDGVTSVTQKITLKNLTSQFYVSNFTLTIGSTQISDVTASDEQGTMEAKVEQKDNKTSINVRFNQQVAGIGKTQAMTLKFKSKDFAQALGKTWEVNLPKIPSANIEAYSLVLSVPVEFGDPTSISPVPKSESQTFDRLFFTFSKAQLEKSGISVNFGTTQVFDFNMKYQLENTSLFPVVTSITLPPDTQYQDVLVNKISPEPLNVTLDEDGNYLAWYRLPRGEKKEVNVIGSAKLFIGAKNKKVAALSDRQKKELTKADTYWETGSPTIDATMSEIFKAGIPPTTKEKASLIHRYVVNTLQYSQERLNSDSIERLGAVTALNNPESAVCMEFTDLFVTLARAAGIPARELDGFAYSLNSSLRPLSLNRDLLHAWAEYYDDQLGWVMVDPTWENTSGGVDYFNKFDLNHLVLAVKGYSSETPYVSDDIKVTVSEGDFVPKPNIDLSIDVNPSIIAGFPTKAVITIKNQGQSVQPASSLALTAGQLFSLSSTAFTLEAIPPFGHMTESVTIKTPFIWQPQEEVIQVSVAGQKIERKILIEPFYQAKEFPILIALLVGSLVGIYLAILGFHVYQRRNRK